MANEITVSSKLTDALKGKTPEVTENGQDTSWMRINKLTPTMCYFTVTALSKKNGSTQVQQN
jgi:hypothetical protein